jgi:hypothetical protein
VIEPPNDQKPPLLRHGLRQVLLSPGVHPLRLLPSQRQARSASGRVFNFSSFLDRIHPPHTIAYERLPNFVRPSHDSVCTRWMEDRLQQHLVVWSILIAVIHCIGDGHRCRYCINLPNSMAASTRYVCCL